MLEQLRHEVLQRNLELPSNNLVVWSGGNVSGRDPETGYVVIKPSGVPFNELTEDSLVVTDIDGTVVEGTLKPSVDLGIHLHLYRRRPDVFGITHTHQPYATSFALRGEAIPAALTPLTHLIGGPVPCTRYATPGDEDTAVAILEATGRQGWVALARRHGVFAMGRSASESLMYTLYLEEAAKTIRLAQIAGPITSIDEREAQRQLHWHEEHYGQNVQ
ncbi:MAG: class II aldolase/adducin family protein [Bifidobacterium sp.]